MDKKLYNNYVAILKSELVPALGCTEPIAIAFAAAKAREVLGAVPEHMEVLCSGNIIKNVKGVTVPNSHGLKGIDVAAVLGAVGGDANRDLQVLQSVTPENIETAKALLAKGICVCRLAEGVENLYIRVTAAAGGDTAAVELKTDHTHITEIVKNGKCLFSQEANVTAAVDKSLLTVRGVLEFADALDVEDVRAVLERQIAMNTAISDEGLTGKYGVAVGKTLLDNYGTGDVRIRARARAAAGSDARMSGCSLPVVINSGSGNQGITLTMPIVTYAEELGASHEKLLRALALGNLLALLQKRQIGNLSAFCGAVCAATGSACGVAYLHGAGYDEISRTITNALCTIGGMVCDGAKPSCAAKISAAVDAALTGWMLARSGKAFANGEGLVKEDVEKTIDAVGRMGRVGMGPTDVEIMHIMLED